MAKIEIFSSPNCGYCEQAKALLDGKGWAYEDLDIAGEAGYRDELLRRLPRVRSLPQIFIAGEHIGGYEDLRLLDKQGRLDALVERAPE